MPATINPIRKARLKKELLNPDNRSISSALIKAGYAKASAEGKSGAMAVVKVCQAEILRDILKETTVKSVLEELDEIKVLSKQEKDYSTAARCIELKGKHLAMFTDKQEISQAEKEDNQFSLERLSRIKQTNGN